MRKINLPLPDRLDRAIRAHAKQEEKTLSEVIRRAIEAYLGHPKEQAGAPRRVLCEVDEVMVEGDQGPVPGVCVACSRCGEQAEVPGNSPDSLQRALAILQRECPQGETNIYET